ncbi:hypothetical protein B0H34DRAFT_676272 [Crassisporium funariophilum]|nr:hypothetical protein B0H34DRAFT_676272 [Crassisporium funariophilum]
MVSMMLLVLQGLGSSRGVQARVNETTAPVAETKYNKLALSSPISSSASIPSSSRTVVTQSWSFSHIVGNQGNKFVYSGTDIGQSRCLKRKVTQALHWCSSNWLQSSIFPSSSF